MEKMGSSPRCGTHPAELAYGGENVMQVSGKDGASTKAMHNTGQRLSLVDEGAGDSILHSALPTVYSRGLER